MTPLREFRLRLYFSMRRWIKCIPDPLDRQFVENVDELGHQQMMKLIDEEQVKRKVRAS